MPFAEGVRWFILAALGALTLITALAVARVTSTLGMWGVFLHAVAMVIFYSLPATPWGVFLRILILAESLAWVLLVLTKGEDE